MSLLNFKVGGYKHKAMLNALMYMIVKDNMPLQTPQKEGFKVFCKNLQPLYCPPNVVTLVNNLKSKYADLSLKIRNEMAKAESVCLTTDIWTHKHTMQSYLGVTAHYVIGKTREQFVLINISH